MKLTTFFKLKKPEGMDVVNVDDFNDNADIIDAALNEAASKSGDMSEGLVFATTASSRSALNSGDSLATILSKLMKWLSDLKTGAFNTVVNNDTTTAAGYVADARVVAEHGTEIDGIDTRVSALETSFPAGCDTIYQGSVTAGVTPTAKTPSALAAAYTAVKNFWIHNDRVGSAAAADVRNGRTFTNDSAVGQEGTMPDLTASNFTGAHSATAAGAASNYTVKAGKAGYVPNGTTVNSLAAATSPTIATTAETGTKVINIKPGYYNKISVNQTFAYNAGVAAGSVLTYIDSFGERTTKTFNDSAYSKYLFVVSGEGEVRIDNCMASGTSYNGTYTLLRKNTINDVCPQRIFTITRGSGITIVSGDRSLWTVFGMK